MALPKDANGNQKALSLDGLQRCNGILPWSLSRDLDRPQLAQLGTAFES